MYVVRSDAFETGINPYEMNQEHLVLRFRLGELPLRVRLIERR